MENQRELFAFENDCLASGGEGVCLKSPFGKYKHTRGTLKDQTLLKIKRFSTAEAEVISVSRFFNGNEKEENPLGYAERSTCKENLIPTDILGKMHVRGLNREWKGVEFSIGNFDGLDDSEKRALGFSANRPDSYFQIFQEEVKRPRHPVFLEFRPDWDFDNEDATKIRKDRTAKETL